MISQGVVCYVAVLILVSSCNAPPCVTTLKTLCSRLLRGQTTDKNPPIQEIKAKFVHSTQRKIKNL